MNCLNTMGSGINKGINNKGINYNSYVTKTSVGLYDYYTVKSTTNTAIINIINGVGKSYYYMAVAGGGGGSCRGGGGGGGFLDGILNTMESEELTINVGSGGITPASSLGVNGNNTTVQFKLGTNSNITCIGGGGGGYAYVSSAVKNGVAGGSGGGGENTVDRGAGRVQERQAD